MQQYILNDITKEFSDKDIHHILNVMRFNDGDKIRVCFLKTCYIAKLNIKNDIVSYEIIEEIKGKRNINITLLQANLKGTKLDTTVKYATIFGATNIIITDFKRSVAKIKNEEHKIKRFNTIAKEAVELSKRSFIPEIKFVNSIENINYNKYELIILADEDEKNLEFDELITKYNNISNILIIIGPEGGIDETERTYFKNISAITLSLGKYIYPAEIASIKLINLIDNYFDK